MEKIFLNTIYHTIFFIKNLTKFYVSQKKLKILTKFYVSQKKIKNFD